MRKEEKGAVIKQIATIIGKYTNFYLTDVAMLNASTTNTLRKECNKQGIKLIVVKNTLFKKVLAQIEGNLSVLNTVLKGNTAIMFSNNANTPAKLIKTFSDEVNILKLKAAYVQEGFYLGGENLDFLISIKSKNELIGDIIVLLQSSVKRIVLTLNSGEQTIYEILKALLKR